MNKLLPHLLFIFILSGCVQSHIVDDVNIISAVGYDAHENGKIRGTAIIPVFKADHSVENFSFSGIGDQSKEFFRQIQDKSADPLVNGSIVVVLYGKKLAEGGIQKILDTFQRDANIGGDLLLAVVDGEAKEILEQSLGNHGTGSYLHTILEHNMTREDIPLTNLHLFLRTLYGIGRDPFLPYIRLEGNKVNVMGVALFKKDKVVDYLVGDEVFFFKNLMMNSRNGNYTFKWDDSDVTINSIILDRKFKVNDTLSNPTISIDVKIGGEITEFSGDKLTIKVIKEIQENFSRLIIDKTESLLARFQKQGIDPVALGHMAKTKTRNFDEKKWDDLYPTATIQVNAEVIITATGVIE